MMVQLGTYLYRKVVLPAYGMRKEVESVVLV